MERELSDMPSFGSEWDCRSIDGTKKFGRPGPIMCPVDPTKVAHQNCATLRIVYAPTTHTEAQREQGVLTCNICCWVMYPPVPMTD